MAYGIYLAAIHINNVDELKLIGKLSKIQEKQVAKIVISTHYFVTNGIGLGNFDKIFVHALEADHELNENLEPSIQFWHPLREPRYILPEDVKEISKQLEEVWSNIKSSIPPNELEYYLTDIDPILEFYRFASENNYCVLSFLTKPFDEQQAKKVNYPIEVEPPVVSSLSK